MMLVISDWLWEWADIKPALLPWYFTEEFFEDNREYWPTSFLMYVAM